MKTLEHIPLNGELPSPKGVALAILELCRKDDATIAEVARIGARQSMDGKGCWRDNVFVERLWRSVKYEEVYLRAYATVRQAREGISRYLNFFNSARPHTAHDGKTPDSAYYASLPAAAKAA